MNGSVSMGSPNNQRDEIRTIPEWFLGTPAVSRKRLKVAKYKEKEMVASYEKLGTK